MQKLKLQHLKCRSGIFPEGKTGKMGYPQKKFGYTCVPSDNQLKLLTDHLVLVLPSLKHI